MFDTPFKPSADAWNTQDTPAVPRGGVEPRAGDVRAPQSWYARQLTKLRVLAGSCSITEAKR